MKNTPPSDLATRSTEWDKVYVTWPVWTGVVSTSTVAGMSAPGVRASSMGTFSVASAVVPVTRLPTGS